jgi:hypothetical protein
MSAIINAIQTMLVIHNHLGQGLNSPSSTFLIYLIIEYLINYIDYGCQMIYKSFYATTER